MRNLCQDTVYVHPTAKQCNYSPDLSNYITKADLNNFDMYSKAYTLLQQYDITSKTFFDNRTSTSFVNDFATTVDVLPLLPKRSHMLKITADAYTSTHTMSGSLHTGNNVFCAAASGGVGFSINASGGGTSISAKNITLSSLRVEIVMSIIYIKETDVYYVARLRSLGQGHGTEFVSDTIADKIEYAKQTSLLYRIGAYTAAYSTQSDIPELTCTISGSPKFSIYAA